MKNQLISDKTAWKAKKKHFREPTHYFYLYIPKEDLSSDVELASGDNPEDHNDPFWDNTVSAPPQSFLQKWLRDKHGIHIEILLSDNIPYNQFYYRVMKIGQYFTLSHDDYHGDTYEDALEIGLQKALEFIDKQ